MNKEIVLGCTAKDKITGLTGIVIARTEWLNGCVRITIQPKKLQDGRPIEAPTFDIEQLEYVNAGIVTKAKPSGGDRRTIERAKDPR